MVNGVSGNSSMQAFMPPPPSNSTSSLTDDQSQLIQDTLAEFDADSLSTSDALSIVETFSEAGIQPSAAMATAMEEAGFDARTIGDLAGAQGQGGEQGMPPPPPPSGQNISQSLEISDDLLSELNELLNEYYSDDLSDEDKSSALSSIQEILQAATPEDGLLHVTA